MAEVNIVFRPLTTIKKILEGTSLWLIAAIQDASSTSVVNLVANDYIMFSVMTDTQEVHTYSYTLTGTETIDLPMAGGTPVKIGTITLPTSTKTLEFVSGYYKKVKTI